MADYIIENGNWYYFGNFTAGDTILVQSGGALYYATIPSTVESVTLEDGGGLMGQIQTAKEFTIQGSVYCAWLDLTLDISDRSPEAPIFVEDWSVLTVNDLSLYVSPSQSEGTYRLAGNAADFSKTITVSTPAKVQLGTVSLDNPEFDYGYNRYTLHVNEAEELCLTVSQNIPEGANILCYKEGQFVGTLPIANDYVIPSTTFDQLVVLSGGKANAIRLEVGGMLAVMDGGVADSIRIVVGTLEVMQGGKASEVVIASDGIGEITDVTIRVIGGIVDGLYSGYGLCTSLYVGDSGIIRNMELSGFGTTNCSLTVAAGGRLENSTLSACYSTVVKHEAYVMAGGTIYKVKLSGGTMGCYIIVYGEAYDTELTGTNAYLNLEEGGLAYRTVLNAERAMMTVAGAEAYDTDVKAGSLHVSSGGTVRNTKLTGEYDSYWGATCGEIVVSEGGLVLDTQITGGTLTVKQGGVASRTELSSMGSMAVIGGLASEINLADGGSFRVEQGGVAQDVHAVRDVAIKVGAGGVVSALSLDACNMLLLESKGRAKDVNVASRGYVYLKNGGVLGGRMQLADGAVVYAFKGGRIDFDMSKANDSTALLSDLSMITGAPCYTITVSADIAAGTYLLADGAAGFTGTMSVQDDRYSYGELAVSDSLTFGWNTYTLNLNQGTLSLTVARNLEEAPSEGVPLDSDPVYGVNVTSGETITLSDGNAYTDVVVNDGGILIVQAETKLDKISLNSGGSMTVEDGASADSVNVTSGMLEVVSGGKVMNVICDGATIRVEGGEIDGIERVDLESYYHHFGSLSIESGGIVRNAKLEAANAIGIESGGLLDSSTLIGWSQVLYVMAGGSATSISVNGGYNSISLSGVAVDTLVTGYSAGFQLWDGGLASRTLLDSGDAVMIVYGGVASDTEVRRGTLTVSSGGTIQGTRLNGQFGTTWNGLEYVMTELGVIVVSEGGLGLDTVITTGDMTVKYGGIVSRTQILSSGSLDVYGGQADDVTLAGGGQLTVHRGGRLNGVHAVRDGAVNVGSDGLASAVEIDNFNAMMVAGGGRAEDVTVASGGEVYLQNRAVLGGHMQFAEGALVYVFDGGTIDFDMSKANAATALLNDLSMIAGTPDFTITVSADTEAGTYLLAGGAAGFAGTITVQDDRRCYGDLSVGDTLTFGWNTYELNLNAGTLSLTVSRNADEVPVEGVERQTSDKTIYNALIPGGETVLIASGYTYIDATVDRWGTVNVQSGAKVKESIVESRGSIVVQDGGFADSVTLKEGATLEVQSGGTVTNLLNDWATIRVEGGVIDGFKKTLTQYVNGQLYIGENGVVRNATLNVINDLTIDAGGLLENASTTYGTITVNAGGTLNALSNGGPYGGANVFVYGVANDMEIVDDGSLTVKEGGKAYRTLLDYSNYTGVLMASMTVMSGGTGLETEVIMGELHVSSGGTIQDTVLNGQYASITDDATGKIEWKNMGDVMVSEGGLSLDTTVNAGQLSVKRGGVASRTHVTSTGNLIVMNAGFASDTDLEDGGRIFVSRGGVAEGVHAVRDGLIDVCSDGIVSSAVLDAFNMMTLSSGGRAEDVTVSSAGGVYLQKGGVLGGHMQLADGAIVSAAKGGIIDFDISKANDTTALLDNLSAIAGTPDFTITVSETTAAGTYRLADGAAGFTGTITVRDAEQRYGDLSLTDALTCGWNTYTLNLVDGALSLSIVRNGDFLPPQEEEELEIVVTSGSDDVSGDVLHWEKTGETVRVTSDGVLQDADIPWGGTVILEENATLQGALRIGADVLVEGPVNASDARLELDISERKEEYGTLLSDMSLLLPSSYTVLVDPDQNKGEYILAGGAQNFGGSLTVKGTDGTYRGTLSLSQSSLDYGITRYTLVRRDNNDLVFIVSSTFEDELSYVLLYKDRFLVLAKESVSNITVSGDSEYDQINVIDKGVAEWITIGDGGVAEVEAGGYLLVSEQAENSVLRFDYTAGDSTVIKGINKNGAYFFVENDRMENVCGENLTVKGNVTVRDYYGQGSFIARNGVSMTGTAEGGGYEFSGATIYDFKMKKASESVYLFDGTTLQNTEWNASVYMNANVFADHSVFNGTVTVSGATVTDAVFNSSVKLTGGTLTDVVFNSDVTLAGYMYVGSDLTFNKKLQYNVKSNPYFDMYGHTAIFDFTGRRESDDAIIMLDAFSEDVVFQLNLNRNQYVGKYKVSQDESAECDPLVEGDITAGARRGLVDTYNICIDGTIVGTIDGNHPSFESGGYVYTMTCENDTELFLTIDISETAGGDYNVLWYNKDFTADHAASATGLSIGGDANCYEAVVRDGGVLGESELNAQGVLKVQAGGQVADLVQTENGALRFDYKEGDSTIITGTNQYGTFMVTNNVLGNVYGENITLTGAINIRNYHGIGTLTTEALDEPGTVKKHSTMTGTVSGGYYKLHDTDISDFVLENTLQFDYYSGTINNALFKRGTVCIRGGSVSDTVFDTYVTLHAGTYSNIELNRGYRLYGQIFLTGDITVRAAGSTEWNAVIQVNGHTVNADYTDISPYSGSGILSIRQFSEGANFRLLFRDDQETGTYIVAENAGSLTDYFMLNVGGVDLEELSAENTEMDYNGYHYTLAHNVDNQKIYLTISSKEETQTAEELSVSYLNVADGNYYYADSLDGFIFDWDHYRDVRVKDHGFVSNSELGSMMTVEAGGQVITLDQKEGGSLYFDYKEGDSTVITGMNPYGAFFVEDNLLENVYGYSVSVTGNVLVNKYHNAGGTLTIDGGTASGQFDGTGTLNFLNSVVTGFSGYGQTYDISKSFVEDAIFYGPIELGAGTYSEVVVSGRWFIDGIVNLDGDMTFTTGGRNDYGEIGYKISKWTDSCINGNGNALMLDLTKRSVSDPAFMMLSRIYNTELQVTVDLRQPIGTYTLATRASQIGLKDFTGVLNQETNQWMFQGATVGDLDSVITVYDTNGIEVANCTVNGDTEYYGRYNYSVFVDEGGNLKLKVGWNNRDGLTYAADEKEENDSFETATVIAGSGKDVVRSLTIHSATDEDYFTFNLESPGRKSSYIGIEFKQWAGDLDISLYNSDHVLIDYARSVTDNERLSLSGFAAGTYYLKVSGYNGNTNAYKLVYDLPETIQMDDAYETGDDPSTPFFLERPEGQITINANISRPDDVDYYMFVLPERGLVSDVISLSYDDEFGDLDLYLYDQDGTTLLVSSTNTVGGQERITMAGIQAGVYYAAVKSKAGSIGRYDLAFDVNSHEVNPDRLEANDTMKKATKLYTLNGKKTLDGLSIHSDEDVDYFRFSILEKGSADDSITLTCEPSLGDLDIEILNADGDVVAYSRTAEIDDVVSLKGLDVGEYYIRVYGYNNVANNYSLSWNVTNSALIPSDAYEGNEPILLRENQTVTGLSIAKVCEEDETRADTFKIVLEYNAWKRSKIILTDYRSDWEEGMAYVLKDSLGNVVKEGKDSEISLYELKKGDYYLTLDAPKDDEYSEYTLITQNLPDSDNAKDNAWSIFIYVAADNNLENCLMRELNIMQRAILPEDVEVYLLVDRADGMSVSDRDWSDTRVGKLRHSIGSALAVEWMYFDGVNTNTYANAHNLNLKKEWDTGNVATLGAFLDWGMREGRAENYALIMTDHGSSLGFNSSDGKSHSIMNIQSIADLLSDEKYKDISVVAFEQCEMGSDVVVSAMEGIGTVDYVVASEAIGWVPNWMIRYDVLLNNLDPEMTSRELSQKIVDSCDCSGYLDLTMASFKTTDNVLTDALNQFGALASEFTYSDWIALCKSFSKVHNYGDDICASSDLGSLLNQIRSYHTTISSTLLDATNALYDTVMNSVIDSTKITPEIYGTGLAVFNPVLSDPMMATYSYGGDSKLDYYATSIGKSAWGDFMYTLSRMAEDCSDYIVDVNGSLNFTDYSYYYDAGEIKNSYNLGAFSGNGVSFSGLYLDDSAYYDITLLQPGEQGDVIVVTADNPNAKITVYLTQTLIPSDKELADGKKPYSALRRQATDGVIMLDGVDYDKNRAFNEYHLIITSTEETTYSIDFGGTWTSGVDYFDYSRAKTISPLAAGNNSIDKATVLPGGKYGGLVTCAGDEDYYKVLAVYADTLDVTVTGTGLVVQEYNEAGELLQTAVEENGQYKFTVANENYVCVSGTADITKQECDPYTLTISEAAQTYLKAEFGAMLPEKPVVTSQITDNNEIAIDVKVADGLNASYSTDLQTWKLYEGSLVTSENGRYYFKAVDPTTGVESRYVSLMVAGIDKEPPTVGNVVADVTDPTNGDVIVTAEFSDDIEVAYGLYWVGENGEPQKYENGVTVTENATVYFQAVDVAGNSSAVVSYVVANIDKVAPAQPTVTADVDTATNGDVLVTAKFSEDSVVKEYTLDGGETWNAYTDPVKFEQNGSVTFRAKDAVGNPSETTYEVTNIDKVAPAQPTVTADVIAATNGDVLVTAEFSEDSTVKEYLLDGGETWNDYTAPVKFEQNGSVTFRAKDAAGNPSEATYEVTNIDKKEPVITLTGDVTTPCKQATLTAAVDEDVEILYSTDQEKWTKYEGEITVDANATYYFKATDAALNEGTASITFGNIDTVPPVLTLTGDVTTPCKQATLTAAVDDGSPIFYQVGDSEWIAYTGAITVDANATYYFKATDAAGNTTTAEKTFTNIDTTAPVITLTGDDKTPCKQATLTAAVDDGSPIFYQVGDSEWIAYTEAITVDANATYNFKATDAALNEGTASITFANIDTVAPDAPVASADVTTATNTDVYVSATFSEDTVKKEYSLDNGETWKTYTAPIPFAENGTVSFRGVDAAGNVSEVTTYEVTNIDKVALEKPIATADVLVPTNTEVHVSAIFPEDAVLKEYSRDGETWETYTDPIPFTENGTVYFRNIDDAGNISEVTAYEVKNIDKVAPEAPTATADIETATNGVVLVSATFSEDSAVKEYSLDGGETWNAYTAPVEFEKNGSVMFRGTDAADNPSEVTTYDVTNIDTTAPVVTLTGDVKTPCKQATLTAAVDDGSPIFYQVGDSEWIAYTEAITVDANATYNFKATDAALNEGTASITFGNIDTTAPVITLTGDVKTPCKQATLTAAVDDDVEILYSTDNLTWTKYEGEITVDANATYYFKATDAAMNEGTASITFANIDTTAPVITLTGDVTTPCKQATLTAVVDDGSPIFYQVGDSEWIAYTEAITVDANATYNFKATDAALNEGTASITFANIDTVAPDAPTAAADVTTATNTDVYVSATFSEDTVKKEYSIDNGETWKTYTEAIPFAENGKVSFRGVDAAGNISKITTYEVTNIDKVAQEKPIATADVLVPTNTDVHVSAIFPEDAVLKEYSLDGETWETYTDPIPFTENGTVYFRNTDDAGNVSEVTTYEVKNIDTVAPVIVLSGDNLTSLQASTLTAAVDDGSEILYSTDNQTWKKYECEIAVTANATYYFTATDAAGNTGTAEYVFANIDTVAPAKPVATADVIALTNKDVTVTATFSEDSVTKEYSIDGGATWQDYEVGGVIIIINGTVLFRGTDAAGNVSDVTEYKVENIDKVAPAAPTGLKATVADQTVTLSWTASTDDLAGVKEYVVTYAHDGQEFTANTTATSFVIENADNATWQWIVQAIDAVGNISEAAAGEAFTVVEAVEPEPETKYVAKFDISGNGVSDVMFVWTGANDEGNYQHGYWMDGTSSWQSAGVGHPAEWENLGCFDMAGDGKADSVLVGNVVVNDVKGAYIGYYADADDTDANWTNIGYLNNADDIDWKNKVGNLTGGTANSIVWYAPELYALGAWTDGTDSWTTISNSFGGADWALVGCGDFDGDSKESVVMSGLGGMYFYTADLDGTVASMGAANWSGWTVRAIGDFKGDGKDDLVLFHKEYGSMVMLANGNLDDFASIGQLDANDWFVVGAGDYNGDEKDDLLVRQYSTGMLGYYTSGDTTQWNVLGYGVGMEWTVIA